MHNAVCSMANMHSKYASKLERKRQKHKNVIEFKGSCIIDGHENETNKNNQQLDPSWNLEYMLKVKLQSCRCSCSSSKPPLCRGGAP